MVTPGRSRPASLTNDRWTTCRAVGRATRRPCYAPHIVLQGRRRAGSGGAPVPLSAKEMQAIVRGGTAPVRIGQRIVAATPVAKKTTRGKVKPEPARRPSGSAPSLRPPGSGESR